MEGSVEQMNDTGSAMTSAEEMNDMQQATVTEKGDQCSALFSQQKTSAGVSPALELRVRSPLEPPLLMDHDDRSSHLFSVEVVIKSSFA